MLRLKLMLTALPPVNRKDSSKGQQEGHCLLPGSGVVPKMLCKVHMGEMNAPEGLRMEQRRTVVVSSWQLVVGRVGIVWLTVVYQIRWVGRELAIRLLLFQSP